jgi:hypothetical protein
MAGTVYFLRCPSNGLVKIGFTAGPPDERFRRIATLSPHPLEPVATMAGSLADEAALHARFLASWSHGEWFRTSADLDALIAERGTPWALDQAHVFNPPVSVAIRKPTLAEWAASTMVEIDDETRTVAEWAKKCSRPLSTIKALLEEGLPARDVLLSNKLMSANKFRLGPQHARKAV